MHLPRGLRVFVRLNNFGTFFVCVGKAQLALFGRSVLTAFLTNIQYKITHFFTFGSFCDSHHVSGDSSGSS